MVVPRGGRLQKECGTRRDQNRMPLDEELRLFVRKCGEWNAGDRRVRNDHECVIRSDPWLDGLHQKLVQAVQAPQYRVVVELPDVLMELTYFAGESSTPDCSLEAAYAVLIRDEDAQAFEPGAVFNDCVTIRHDEHFGRNTRPQRIEKSGCARAVGVTEGALVVSTVDGETDCGLKNIFRGVKDPPSALTGRKRAAMRLEFHDCGFEIGCGEIRVSRGAVRQRALME